MCCQSTYQGFLQLHRRNSFSWASGIGALARYFSIRLGCRVVHILQEVWVTKMQLKMAFSQIVIRHHHVL